MDSKWVKKSEIAELVVEKTLVMMTIIVDHGDYYHLSLISLHLLNCQRDNVDSLKKATFAKFKHSKWPAWKVVVGESWVKCKNIFEDIYLSDECEKSSGD